MTEKHGFAILMLVLLLLAAGLFFASLFTGPADIGLYDGLLALAGGHPLTPVMREIRLPRALAALLIGGSLGLSGAALQGYMRNPLTEPGLIGITGAASLGAVIAIYTGFAMAFLLALPLSALIAAAVAVSLIQLLAGRSSGPVTLILAGVAISSLCGALVTLVLNLSPNPYAVMEIMFWMLGSLADLSMTHVMLALPFVFVGWAMLFSTARMLNMLTLGQDAAVSMGMDARRLKFFLVLGTATSVGVSTAIAGAIGFVGLVVPHILRPLVSAMPSRLLPASAAGGAIMVLASDIAVRWIAPERDLKLGVLTAIIGAPFFLWLVLRSRMDGR